ncbi:MAG TPA: ATP-binding protein, partial [Tepidisphaeraceae bacterium]|nr:ATP-binding protein [Tepidisphaeraceae bacterium]
ESCLRVGEPADQLLCHILEQSKHPTAAEATFTRLNSVNDQQNFGELQLSDGRVFQQFTAPLMADGLPMRGRAWFFHDVTAKRMATQELTLAKERADAANRAKSTFLANVSHEIRTPMTAVLGYAELLMMRRQRLESPLDEWVQTIHRSANRLVTLLNDILELSKIEVGRLTIEPVDCHTNDIVLDVFELFKQQAQEKSVNLEIEYSNPYPSVLHTDPNRLRQILMNLVGNALKFTDAGSVRIVVGQVGQELCVDVIDTGVGITPEEQSHIFEPFAQARSAHSHKKRSGAGLGLAISRRLARLLGGDIDCQSTSGLGSHFTLTVKTQLFAESASETANPPTAESSIANARVLVVDDVPAIREYLRTVLGDAGATVTTADDGVAAVAAANRAVSQGSRFDVILMDMQMPHMDGYAATRALRDSGYAGPIVALTASAMEADRERCMAAGCDAFEGKPLNRVSLLNRIAQYAAEQRRREAA